MGENNHILEKMIKAMTKYYLNFILTIITALILLMGNNIASNESISQKISDKDYSIEKSVQSEGETHFSEEEEDLEDEEDEIAEPAVNTDRYIYTADISDEMLKKLFAEDPKKLGSISIGFTNLGRLINGVKFPQGDDWTIVNPSKSYGTEEVINYIMNAAKAVREKFPDAPPLRINDLSAEKGGHIRPHKSHQNGRDVDIGFYYIYDSKNPKVKVFDIEKNWEFIKAIITKTDVQVILVDRRIQKQLYEYAKNLGENIRWLDSIFKSGKDSILKHFRRHRSHFHIRFYSPRAQELGKRIHPILDKAKEEERIALHKVKRGECLSKIATKYNSSVKLIKRANHLKSNKLKVGVTLFVPLLGPCTNCPKPPDVWIPRRRLPEDFMYQDENKTTLSEDKIGQNQIPLNFYFNLYPFARINGFWLKLDKY